MAHMSKEIQAAHPDLCLEAVRINPYFFCYVVNSTVPIMKEVITHLKYDIFTEKVFTKALKKCGDGIQYVSDPSDAMVAAAVKRNPAAFCSISQPTPKHCRAAVISNGLVLRYISGDMQAAHPDICITAVEHCRAALFFIRNPTIELIRRCFSAISESISVVYAHDMAMMLMGYSYHVPQARNLGVSLFQLAANHNPYQCMKGLRELIPLLVTIIAALQQ